jgi:1-deoxy-D-xylulose-5-phosphate reductoisomerase
MKDGAIYSQMGNPNMSLPIIEGLLGPYYAKPLVDPLSFAPLSLTFEKPDFDRFPLLKLSYDILKCGKGYPVAFNASNEVAVEYFLKKELSYLQLQDCIIETLQGDFSIEPSNIQQAIEIDKNAREIARNYIKAL